jgi:hypothetical protein
MSLIPWGSEFPVSGNIPNILDSIVHRLRPVRSVIRTLFNITFLFEDSTLLIIPVRVLQSAHACQALRNYLANPTNPLPDDLYFLKAGSAIVSIQVVYEPEDPDPFFVIFKADFTYDTLHLKAEAIVRSPEPVMLTIQEGELRQVYIKNGFIALVTETEAKFTVYCARFQGANELITGWALQTELTALCEIDIQPPALYFFKPEGLFGCSLDHSGRRRFPRPLVPVISDPVVSIQSPSQFLVFSKATREISEVTGRKAKAIVRLDGQNDYQAMVVLGNRAFAVADEAIDTCDVVTGEIVTSMAVPKTEKWIVSLEESYGLVFVGTKSFTISKAEVGPYIALYAPKGVLLGELKKARYQVGTVAAAILMMANRSGYLAAMINKDDIAVECRKQSPPGSLQEHVRPVLMKLHDLLQNKPT